jgi:hypothetical protein
MPTVPGCDSRRPRQEPHAFEILGVEAAREDLLEAIERRHYCLRHVAQVGPSAQVDRGREFGDGCISQVGRETVSFQPGQEPDFPLREGGQALAGHKRSLLYREVGERPQRVATTAHHRSSYGDVMRAQARKQRKRGNRGEPA